MNPPLRPGIVAAVLRMPRPRSCPVPFLALCLASVIACLAPASAAAAPAWLAPQTLSDPDASAFPADIGVDENGDVLVVWRLQDGVNERIQVDERTAGGSFEEPRTLSAAGQDADEPQAAVNARGDAVVAWRRFDGSDWRIEAALRPAGGEFGAPQLLSVPGQNSFSPEVAIDGDGDVMVAWRRHTSSGWLVDATVRPAGATSFGAASAVSTLTPLVFHLQLRTNAAGDALLAWEQEEGSASRIWVVERLPGGSHFGTAHPLSPESVLGGDPRVGVGASGEATAVWVQLETGGVRVWGAVRPPGGEFGAPVPLSRVGDDGNSPWLAVAPSGDAVAVWRAQRGASALRVEASERSAGGAFQEPQLISADGGEARAPRVAVDGLGGGVIAWERFDGANWRAEAATRAPGGGFGPPVALSAAGADAFEPRVAMDPEGNAVAAWPRFGGSNYRAQLAAYDAAGPRLRALSIPSAATAGHPAAFSVAPFDTWSPVASTDWAFGDGAHAAGDAVSHTYGSGGQRTVSVVATDAVGNATSASGTIAVAGQGGAPANPGQATPPPPTIEPPPAISDASLAPRRIRLGRRGRAATLRFTLSRPARVAMIVLRGLPGRRVGHGKRARCAKPKPALRRHRRCRRFKRVARFAARSLPAGRAAIRFAGRIRGRPLPPGRFKLRLVPRDAAGGPPGRAVELPFSIVRASGRKGATGRGSR